MVSLSTEDCTALNHSILFQGLELDTVVPLLEGHLSAVSVGTFLFQEGQRIDHFHVLLSGTVHASFFDRNGREFLYQQLTPGQIVGGEIVCTPQKITPYCTYTEDRVRLWSFPWSKVEGDSDLPPELRMTLLKNLLNFVANLNIRKYYKIDALSTRSARERILKYLIGQAVLSRSTTFTVPMDREGMANYLCLNRSVLSHELKQMEEDGLIQFRKNQFTLSDTCCPPNFPVSAL